MGIREGWTSRGGLVAALLLGAWPLGAQDLAVPSGEPVELYDVLVDEDGTTRWRFLAPGVRGLDANAVLADMQALCDGFVIPSMDSIEEGERVIVSLMDRPVEFGKITPEARQHFEAYRLESGACVWEIF